MKNDVRHITGGSVRNINSETRTVEFVISDASLDDHNTILKPAGWDLERFNKNGIVGYQHYLYDMSKEPNPDYVLGIGEAFIEGDKLIGRVTFEPEDINPLAEKIFKKVKHGTLKATSVGFIPLEHHKEGDVLIFDRMALIEFSIVNIPSNPNAIKRSINTSKRRENLKKMYLLNF